MSRPNEIQDLYGLESGGLCRKAYIFKCEICGHDLVLCGDPDNEDGGGLYKDVAKTEAREFHGWKRVGGKWRCGCCVAEAERKRLGKD